MEPEAKLIASQAMQELARQQATGQVDEVLRGQIAQQVLGGAAQQAMQREARQQAQDFERLGRLGEVVSSGEREGRLRDFGRNTEKMSGALQALTGGLSAGVGAYADYQAQQELLAKGLQDAEAKGGIAGALKFLEQNPDYDPGEETLQRLYLGSEIGQQTAAELQAEQEANRARMLAAAEARMPDAVRGILQTPNIPLPPPSASDVALGQVTREQLDMPQEVPLAPYYEQRRSLATPAPTMQDQLDSLNEMYTFMENLTPEGRKKVIESYLRALGAM
jgi:hypothetical protein